MSVDMKDVVVRYFTHPNTGRGVACVAAVNTPNGIKIGWSQCNPKDTFNRKVARNIAINRALNPPKNLKPATLRLKMYKAADSPFLPPVVTTVTVVNPVEALVELVESVAKRAFDPNKEVPESTDLTMDDLEGVPFLPPKASDELDELPTGLSFADEFKKVVVDDYTGEIVARRINDEYVPV